jgi:acetyl/propionyl-CoA carboxylase alpha subunit
MNKTYHQIKRILIANRGEIAVRIIKTAKQMGIETIAIYTPGEEEAMHVAKADIRVLMNGNTINETYLNIEQITTLALANQADAIHPGYGFLSENADFADACAKNGIIFIGPSAQQIQWMGNKIEANKIASACDIPLLQKVNGDQKYILSNSNKLQLPLIIKAAAGGGGKGMRIVNDYDKLEQELESAANEAQRYFGNNTIYVEEYIENPRHIEVQILADQHKNIIHLYERECSIQRRHQKVIEEAPAPHLPAGVKQQMIQDAITLSKKIAYTNAGTVEFLLTPDNRHYFLEMNTRIQVEHPVSEEITGIDIVKEQILIAMGMPLSYAQKDIHVRGHAIEVRIYAEDPKEDYMPSFGKIIGTHIPKHPHIRIDGGAKADENLNPSFDPLLKKVISHGNNRNKAIKRLTNFLSDYALFGVKTNRELILQAIKDEDFIQGTYATSFFENKKDKLLTEPKIGNEEQEVLAAAYLIAKNNRPTNAHNIWERLGYWRQYQNQQIRFNNIHLQLNIIEIEDNSIVFEIANNKMLHVSIIQLSHNTLSFVLNKQRHIIHYLCGEDGLFYFQYRSHISIITDKTERIKRQVDKDDSSEIKTLHAPMPGRILDILVKEGESIKKGSPLIILEAMKTENSIKAWKDLTLTHVAVSIGEQVSLNQLLIETE